MTTVRPNPAKPPCTRCGGVWFAKGLCSKCYWKDYNSGHRERQTEYNHYHRADRPRIEPGDLTLAELEIAWARWWERLNFRPECLRR